MIAHTRIQRATQISQDESDNRREKGKDSPGVIAELTATMTAGAAVGLSAQQTHRGKAPGTLW